MRGDGAGNCQGFLGGSFSFPIGCRLDLLGVPERLHELAQRVAGGCAGEQQGTVLAFNAQAPEAGDCANDRIPVLRLYNNGMGGQANHRFTTSRSEARALGAAGWIVEGTVFCALP